MPSYRVTLVNRDDLVIDVAEGQTILDAADAAGVPLPRGCRTGACRTCAARLVKGRVHMPEGTALTEAMVRGGVVLTCVATVDVDTELAVGRPGKPMLAARYLLPWTD